MPRHVAAERARIWIEHDLRLIEAMAVRRIPRTGDAIAVQLSGTDVRQIRVPDQTGPLDERHAYLLARV
jgi:hypothetical protein